MGQCASHVTHSVKLLAFYLTDKETEAHRAKGFPLEHSL
jgi:hypothetical protein